MVSELVPRLEGYPTRPWAINRLLDHGFTVDGVIWEPACGTGVISEALKARGFEVLSTDVHDYGYKGLDGIADFFEVTEIDPSVRAIVSAPPTYVRDVPGHRNVAATQFIEHALELTKPINGVTLLLLPRRFDHMPSFQHLFAEHPAFACTFLLHYPHPCDPVDAPGERSYAWFYWDWRFKGDEALTIPLKPKPGEQ